MDSMFYAPFTCNGDNACLGIKWKKWKRGFEIFLSAKGITEDTRKKNVLLQSVGPEVQDIFFTLPESKDTENERQYDLTMKALDGYFTPKTNTVYQRYKFRSLEQHPGESIDQFISVLLEQGKNCNFSDLNDQIRDQVIEKCLSHELRWTILEKRDIKLEEIKEIAKDFEDAEETSAELLRQLKIQRECSSPTPPDCVVRSPCCKGARPEGQRSEQGNTFSISQETTEENIPCNRMHNPVAEKKTGFW